MPDPVRPLAEAKSVSLQGTGTEDVCLRCEADRLVEVLTNLVGNAIEFAPEGGHISVNATERRDFLEIEVADTGPGIAPAQLPYVFGRYWQARERRSSMTASPLLHFAWASSTPALQCRAWARIRPLRTSFASPNDLRLHPASFATSNQVMPRALAPRQTATSRGRKGANRKSVASAGT
jgi:hypothetical protein